MINITAALYLDVKLENIIIYITLEVIFFV